MQRFHGKTGWKNRTNDTMQCNVTISRKNWIKQSAGQFKTFILYRFNVAQDYLNYTSTKL